MDLTALAAPSATEEPPLLFAAVVWSILIMLVVFVANLVVHLLRPWFGPLDRLVEGARQDVYLTHVRGPAAAVLVAATSGYGINVVTGDSGSLEYLGLLMALPLPLAMVTWAGVRAVRQADFEQAWPPEVVPVDDRVKVRYVLRRIRAEADRLPGLPAGELDRLGVLLTELLDVTVPALRARRDRGLGRWLRDHPVVAVGVGVWSGATVVGAALAVGSGFDGPLWRTAAVVAGFAVVVCAIQAGLLSVLRRRSRHRCAELADEVAATAGGIRRRITEQRLGLDIRSAPAPGRRQR
ncbi:hypothetical protein [Plantactinospora sonchi]|uniref:Uncharacterized protein n=1 Tax=Plantactinospora sonchi TaxID=1544735 RepID=A0ABU7RY11_9ACTN